MHVDGHGATIPAGAQVVFNVLIFNDGACALATVHEYVQAAARWLYEAVA
jgi:hypothetical protein